MQPICLVVGIFFWFCFLPVTAHAEHQVTADYLAELQHQAKQKKLADERVWHLLLKYDKKIFLGMTSEAD
ncbi:MAG: hypothetical protein RBS57_15520, partial [Desulforhabdus sp.]|nr:hypothetical protein [Desulforhabdus sp.]